MIRDLVALALANAALLAAGHGVLRLAGIRPALARSPLVARRRVCRRRSRDRRARLGGARRRARPRAVAVSGRLRGAARAPASCGADVSVRRCRVRTQGWLRLFPVATLAVLALLAVDLAVQPIWTDDAWSIWAAKAESIVAARRARPGLSGRRSVSQRRLPARRAGARAPRAALLRARQRARSAAARRFSSSRFPFALVALLRDRVRPLLLWTAALGSRSRRRCRSRRPPRSPTCRSPSSSRSRASPAGAGSRTGEPSLLWLAAVLRRGGGRHEGRGRRLRRASRCRAGGWPRFRKRPAAPAARARGRRRRPERAAVGALVAGALVGNAFSDAGGASPGARRPDPERDRLDAARARRPVLVARARRARGCAVVLALVRPRHARGRPLHARRRARLPRGDARGLLG